MAKKKAPVTTKPAHSAKPSSNSPMDVALLERIVKLMAEHGLNEMDLQDGDKRLAFKRGLPTATAATQMVPSTPITAPAPAAVLPPPAAAPAEETKYLEIKSPMVGTFYTSPSPDAKAFVSVGSQVTEDTDVCIIEAMKVFNNIKAEVRGTIAKVCVENGKPVEFGTVLFLVKPA